MLKLSSLAGPMRLACNISQRTLASAPEMIKIEMVGEKKNVALITLNRPKALNAICRQLMSELQDAVETFDKDPNVGSIIITGSERAFAAGADIKEMEEKNFAQAYSTDFLANWAKLSETRTPLIAAVNGFVLGGGCELALQCDIIYAGDKAQFGQPEVNIGTIPGGGGTQRWARSAGKSVAMEMCLSGERMGAQEAKQVGIVSKVFPADQVVGEAIKLGEKIASKSPIIVTMIKEAVNKAYETTLHEGLNIERRFFHATFATNDRHEGMSAFVQKRKPEWKNE